MYRTAIATGGFSARRGKLIRRPGMMCQESSGIERERLRSIALARERTAKNFVQIFEPPFLPAAGHGNRNWKRNTCAVSVSIQPFLRA